MSTTIKHPVPDAVKPSFVIFDIQALWCSYPCDNSGCQRVNSWLVGGLVGSIHAVWLNSKLIEVLLGTEADLHQCNFVLASVLLLSWDNWKFVSKNQM